MSLYLLKFCTCIACFFLLQLKASFSCFSEGKDFIHSGDIAKELWLAPASNIQALVVISMLLIED